MAGAEALLRWTDTVLGPIPPSEFIPIAEETGLIRELGEWVIRTVCEQARCWSLAGYEPLRISLVMAVTASSISRESSGPKP